MVNFPLNACGTRVLPLLSSALLAVSLGIASAEPTLALPRDPVEPRDPIGTPPPFQQPANGFLWSVPSHFGLRDSLGRIDYHWHEDTHTYDPGYVNPATYKVNLDGCATQADEEAPDQTVNTYVWTIAGATSAVPSAHTCVFQAIYPAQGTYTVTLDVKDSSGAALPAGRSQPFSQQVTVKDWLIVSIGDSYASGEGNPDIPINGAGPVWEDKRCHRSAFAGAAQAALSIEQSDPKTSVTFISLACSGATIDRPTYKSDLSTQPQGTGILGGYRGTDPDANVGFKDFDRLPSQIDALATTLNGRPVDALIVSGGGNDAGFGNVAGTCVVNAHCFDVKVPAGFDPTATSTVSLSQAVATEIANLPGRYDRLAAAIHDPNPSGRPAIRADHVFLTEYPDFTKAAAGQTCPAILNDIVPWPLDMSALEANQAVRELLEPLNGAVQAAATRNTTSAHDWHYVGGVSAAFQQGHGYCARDNWVRRASESIFIQGPVPVPSANAGTYALNLVIAKQNTTGTLHPNITGHQVYRDQILAAIRPVFAATLPPPPAALAPPAFSAAPVVAARGQNGWLTTPGQVLTVTVSAGAPNVGISAASLTVDGAAGCAATGATCTQTVTAPTSTTPGRVDWTFNLTAEGIHHLDFSASDSQHQVTSFSYELKLDLTPPSVPTLNAAPASGWFRGPDDFTFSSADTAAGSGSVTIEYHVDNGPASFAVPDVQTTLASGTDDQGQIIPLADGSHVIAFKAIDAAGQASTTQSVTVKIDSKAPTLEFQTPDVAANAAGWNKSNVAVPFKTDDGVAGSGVASVAPTASPLVLSTEGAEVSGIVLVSDVAGNQAAYTSPIVKIDKTAPTVTYAGNTGTYGILDTVQVTCKAIDSLSGVDASTNTCKDVSGPAYGFSPGTNTFSASAADLAGNTGTASTSFTLKVTATDLCTLTRQFVETSSRYGTLPPTQQARVDLATGAVCQQLSLQPPTLTTTQKAALVRVFQTGVNALVVQGWLAQAQATTLIGLAQGL